MFYRATDQTGREFRPNTDRQLLSEITVQRWPRSFLAAGKKSSSFLQSLLILRIKYLGLTRSSDPLIPPSTKHLESKSCNHFNHQLLCIPSAPASLKWFFGDLQQNLRKVDVHTAAVRGSLGAGSLLGMLLHPLASSVHLLTPNPLGLMHLDTREAGAWQRCWPSLTLSGLLPCDLCPSLFPEGL